MIFNTNTTSMLGTVDIPMDEAYANSYGAALALVESANNDYNMFRALLNVDAHEISISESASGYVLESELAALHEAAIGGIFNKIKELIKKFIAKVKAIFANFYARIRALFAKDKQLLKDYSNKVRRKTGINNMKVKWRDSNIDIYGKMDSFIQDGSSAAVDKVLEYMKGALNFNGTLTRDALTDMRPSMTSSVADVYNDDPDKMWESIAPTVVSGIATIKSVSNASELKEELQDAIWDDDKASEKQLKDAKSGGSKMSMDTIISRLDNFDKQISKLSKSVTYMQTQFDKLLKDIDNNAKALYKLSDNEKSDEKYITKEPDKLDSGKTYDQYYKADKDKGIVTAPSGTTNGVYNNSIPENQHSKKDVYAALGKASNNLYKVTSVVSDATMTMYNCVLDAAKIEYAQTKAAFVKGITVSEKKLEESYATAIADVVMEEVDEIISNAFNQENPIEDLTSATDDLLGKGVSNDPDHLTYDPNKYTSDADMDDYEGTKSSNYVGTSESAYFSRFIY